MLQSLDQVKNQFESQLDTTLRLIQANGSYAEKMVATHFAMLHELLQTANVPEKYSNEASWLSFSERGNVLAGFYQTWLRDGLNYQQKVLAALSRK